MGEKIELNGDMYLARRIGKFDNVEELREHCEEEFENTIFEGGVGKISTKNKKTQIWALLPSESADSEDVKIVTEYYYNSLNE